MAFLSSDPAQTPALIRNNVRVSGNPDGRPMVFAHGFGCDQSMWRYVAPAFEDEYRVVLFDHVGAGGSDVSAYGPTDYGSLRRLRRRRAGGLPGARSRTT